MHINKNARKLHHQKAHYEPDKAEADEELDGWRGDEQDLKLFRGEQRFASDWTEW